MWKQQAKTLLTMALLDADNDPFIPVTRPKPTKKPRSTLPQGSYAKPEIDMEPRISFEQPRQPRATFNPAHRVKQLITKWIHHDNTLAIQALTNDDILFPVHEPFLMKESDFVSFFYVHLIPNRTRQNLVTIGCHVHTTKTISKLKKSILEDHTMMEWLTTNHVYLEADSLGHETICTIGYFFHVHPTITHYDSFKANIRDALEQVKLPKSEVIQLDPLASSFYDDDNDDEDVDAMIDLVETPYIPPFEFFITPIGHSSGTTRIATHTLAIKTNVTHGKLLHELLIRMDKNNTDNPMMKFIPVSIATTLGPEHYKQMICANHAYLASLATIPVVGRHHH